MTTRITSGAFLSCGDKVLLLKRGLHKEIAPGSWAGIGGHMELDEIKNPRALDLIETCYREVQEETEITKSDIHNLKLKYIAVRKVENDIRLHHHFFGEVKSEMSLPECDEGELYWMDKNKAIDLPMSTSVKETLKHWLNNPNGEDVYFVAVHTDGESATITKI